MTSLYEIIYNWIEQQITLTLPAWRFLFTVRITWLYSIPLLFMRAGGVVVWLSFGIAKVPGSTRKQYYVVLVIFYCLQCFVLFALFLYARLVGTYCGMARASVCLSVCLSTKLVDTIQTEPFKLGPSNLVHLLLMTRRRTLLIFKVKGQGHHNTLLLSLVNTIQTEPFKLGPSNLVHLLLMTRGRTLIDFQGQGSKVKVTITHCC